MPDDPTLDPRGHLTPAGIGALAAAPPGRAPAALAAHVSSCAQCQERVLAGALGAPATRQKRRKPPPPWRAWAILGVLLLALLTLMATLGRLL